MKYIKNFLIRIFTSLVVVFLAVIQFAIYPFISKDLKQLTPLKEMCSTFWGVLVMVWTEEVY